MIDVCDPLGVAISGRFIYFVDDLNRYIWIYLFNEKEV
jgi:hypothetical protein